MVARPPSMHERVYDTVQNAQLTDKRDRSSTEVPRYDFSNLDVGNVSILAT